MATKQIIDANGNWVTVNLPDRPKMTKYGVMEGFTPWGTPITDGRTTEQAYQQNLQQQNATVANQVNQVLGSNIQPGQIQPGGTYTYKDGQLSDFVKPEPVQPDFSQIEQSRENLPQIQQQIQQTHDLPFDVSQMESGKTYQYTDGILKDVTGIGITPQPTDQSMIGGTTGGTTDETTGGTTDVVTSGTTDGTIGDVQTGTEQVATDFDIQDMIGQMPETELTYDTQYRDALDNILQQVTGQSFEYDPNEDPALKQAQDYAARQILEEMNARGILTSSITSDKLAQNLNELIPQYEQLAYDRYRQNRNDLMQLADIYSARDQLAYARSADERDYALNQFKTAYDMQRNKMSDAWDRVNTLGEVDAYAAEVLGLPEGTPSASVREAQEQWDKEMELLDREYAIQQEQTQYNRWRDEISDAWDRVNTLGRVDNVASEVLGLPVGTPSQDAREQMVEAQRQAALYEQQLAAAQQEVEGELQETEKAIAYQTLNSIAAQAFSNPQDAYTVINAIRRNNGIIPDSIWNAMENGDIQINGPLGEIQNLAMKIDDSQVRSLITTDLPNTMEAIRKEAGKITPSVVDADGARNYIDNYIITTPMYGEEPELTENGRLQIIEYLESLNKAGYLNDEDTISIGAEYGIVF